MPENTLLCTDRFTFFIWYPSMGNAETAVLQPTFRLQKRAIRVINNKRYNSHIDPVFKKSNILKIEDLFQYQAALFMYNFQSK